MKITEARIKKVTTEYLDIIDKDYIYREIEYIPQIKKKYWCVSIWENGFRSNCLNKAQEELSEMVSKNKIKTIEYIDYESI